MGNPLFATKSLDTLMKEAADTGEHSLKRALGPVNLITLGIGAIIGAGIFVLTGSAAALYAGPAIMLSYILAGIGCVFAGLCYAEFASMIPIAGSAYTYGYATVGEIIAWIIGWDLILEYAFGAATVILIIGIKESANFNTAIVFVKLAAVLTFIAVALPFVLKHPALAHENWKVFIPPNTGAFGSYGWSGIARGAAVVFFAYIGFDAVSTAAQEARKPQKDMPIGILGSLIICTILYIAVSGLLTS